MGENYLTDKKEYLLSPKKLKLTYDKKNSY